MVWLNLTMLLCILWSSNSCEPNTQICTNLVFFNSLFCTCIPILFLSISYPCIVRILKFKQALTQLLLLQICVKENLVWFVLLMLRCVPPQLSCSNDGRVHHSRDPLQTVFCRLRSPSLPPAPTAMASPSSTRQMNLRSTRVHKRGRTLLFLLMLCIA